MVKIRALYGDETDNGYKAGDVFDAYTNNGYYYFNDKKNLYRKRHESEFELLSDDLPPQPIRTMVRKK